MKSKFLLFLITLSILAGLFLFAPTCSKIEHPTSTTIDTVYILKPYKQVVIKEVEVTKPSKVQVYQTDTNYRKQIEKDTLMTGVELTRNKLKIHTITPRGAVLINQYSIDREIQTLTIDHEGKASIKPIKHAKRRKFFRKIGKVGIFIVGIIVGNNIHK